MVAAMRPRLTRGARSPWPTHEYRRGAAGLCAPESMDTDALTTALVQAGAALSRRSRLNQGLPERVKDRGAVDAFIALWELPRGHRSGSSGPNELDTLRHDLSS